MQTVSVFLHTTNQHYIERFCHILQSMQEKIDTSPVRIECRVEENESHTQFRFVSWSREEYTCETLEYMASFVALLVTEWTVQVMEVELLRTFLKRKERGALIHKFDEIYPYIQFVFHELDEVRENMNRSTRKAAIYEQVLQYMEDEPHLYLEGFVKFRLKNYRILLDKAFEMGLQQYQQDKEYQEFVELLRFFVSKQEHRYPLVHVVLRETQEFIMYDQDDAKIDLSQLDTILGFRPDRQEDYIMSALIALAPEKIVIHGVEDSNVLMQTMRAVFGDRVLACVSCAHCLTTPGNLDFQFSSHYNT
ncbi:putative sporulation protein YtxC [Brevibacillus laterosporus]|uniref:Sporulation protein YtxC n=1 Tax=Brevibacillus laterosporus TaxID=1465 RepID=A0AAP8QGN9_BRELA|nr:putative sporulation protein YtxC [Brevibacillus laterosporus]ATO50409.1 hypothetical protein BrL25_15715 [Brevibacillus laterosporus DSM 25]AYB39402.1 hypothetical protein D5F52_14595 [Brevibacillus laterosporus]MBG9773438.1 hypothetical protein [Brevibacillus laterosporus]MBG9796402.1 hypothetical protein [Brevibacillus laterosporus]MBG9802874.1 hypothetical protein [Brevibacillus laterosporus]